MSWERNQHPWIVSCAVGLFLTGCFAFSSINPRESQSEDTETQTDVDTPDTESETIEPDSDTGTGKIDDTDTVTLFIPTPHNLVCTPEGGIIKTLADIEEYDTDYGIVWPEEPIYDTDTGHAVATSHSELNFLLGENNRSIYVDSAIIGAVIIWSTDILLTIGPQGSISDYVYLAETAKRVHITGGDIERIAISNSSRDIILSCMTVSPLDEPIAVDVAGSTVAIINSHIRSSSVGVRINTGNNGVAANVVIANNLIENQTPTMDPSTMVELYNGEGVLVFNNMLVHRANTGYNLYLSETSDRLLIKNNFLAYAGVAFALDFLPPGSPILKELVFSGNTIFHENIGKTLFNSHEDVPNVEFTENIAFTDRGYLIQNESQFENWTIKNNSDFPVDDYPDAPDAPDLSNF